MSFRLPCASRVRQLSSVSSMPLACLGMRSRTGRGQLTCTHSELSSLLPVLSFLFFLPLFPRQAAKAHPRARHPLLLWNCLPRAGASQFHGHMQVALSQARPLPCPLPGGAPLQAPTVHPGQGAKRAAGALLGARCLLALARFYAKDVRRRGVRREQVAFPGGLALEAAARRYDCRGWGGVRRILFRRASRACSSGLAAQIQCGRACVSAPHVVIVRTGNSMHGLPAKYWTSRWQRQQGVCFEDFGTTQPVSVSSLPVRGPSRRWRPPRTQRLFCTAARWPARRSRRCCMRRCAPS